MIAKTHISQTIYTPKKGEAIHYVIESKLTQLDIQKRETIKTYASTISMRFLTSIKDTYYFQIKCIASNYQGSKTPKLLRKINAAFDHLIIKTNKTGTIIGVNNLEIIREAWQKTKENLKKEYEGDAVFKLFKDIDRTLRTERKLCKALQHPKMYGLYFNGYWVYDNTYTNIDLRIEKKIESDSAIIVVNTTNEEETYTGFFLYKNTTLLEASLHIKSTKYNILCLG